jgi:hypothetical protein
MFSVRFLASQSLKVFFSQMPTLKRSGVVRVLRNIEKQLVVAPAGAVLKPHQATVFVVTQFLH